eukprot:1312977-Pleurochrysis_carterae.AAC.1
MLLPARTLASVPYVPDGLLLLVRTFGFYVGIGLIAFNLHSLTSAMHTTAAVRERARRPVAPPAGRPVSGRVPHAPP